VSAATSSWTWGQRVAFRFGVVYFAAYSLLNGNVATLPLALVSSLGQAPAWYLRSTDAVWSAVGHAIGVRGPIHAFDNGDTIGDHVQLLTFVFVAGAGSLAWSLLDRKRLEYRRGFDLLYACVRYVLAMTVFAYAVFKVFPVQFSVPSPSRLAETYGASSRMTLLWTFMGTSPGYQMFAGWTELTGCALLMSRRTAALGALVLIAILTNIFVMDLCYDVGAKVCVLHLLAMAVFLVVPVSKRLLDVFVRHRSVPALDLGAPRPRRLVAAKIAFIALALCVEGVPVGRYYFTERDGAPLPPLYGAYEVVELRRAGERIPPLLTDASYWHLLTVDRRRTSVTMANGSRVQFARTFDPEDRMKLEADASVVSVTRADGDELNLEGTFKGSSIVARARRVDPKKELLIRQPVRWFSDDPDVR
jgi:hypothetical protein